MFGKKNKKTEMIDDNIDTEFFDEEFDAGSSFDKSIQKKKTGLLSNLFGILGMKKEKITSIESKDDYSVEANDDSFENILNNYLTASSGEDGKNKGHDEQLMEYNYRELLSNPTTHEEFIKDVNKRFKWKYYKTLDELKLDYDMEDYDNMNQIFVDWSSAQAAEGGFGSAPSAMKDKDEPNVEEITRKLELSRNNYCLPLRNKATGKKTLGVAFPNMRVLDFYMQEDIVFIGVEIVNQIWGIKNVDFLTDGDEDEMTANLLKLLTYMDTNGISDLHIYKENETYYAITARMGDTVLKVTDAPIRNKLAEALIRALLVAGKVDTLSRQVEIKALVKKRLLNSVVRNFRVSVVETSVGNSTGKSVSIRKLAGTDSLVSLEALNYSKEAMTVITEIIQTFKKGSGGIIVISGATNSGKTTLLYAILTQMLKKFKNDAKKSEEEGAPSNERKLSRIFTIENPVEITIPDLIQLDLSKTEQADEDNRLTIEKAKNIILRQDPDVALVGEVRAKDEVKTVFELANTGHLAYTTIHANDAKSTMKRIQDTGGIDDNTLRLLMQLIINQELVDKMCVNCKGTGYVKKRVPDADGDRERCPICHKTGKEVNPGVKGRLPVYELVYFNRNLLDLKDDIYDFKKLQEEGKIMYITKGDIAQGYYDKGFLSKKILDKYSGAQAASMTNIMKDKKATDKALVKD